MNKDQIDYQSYIGKIFIHTYKELNSISIAYIMSYDKLHDLFNVIYLKSRYKFDDYNHHIFTKITIHIWIKRSTFNNDCADGWETVIV